MSALEQTRTLLRRYAFEPDEPRDARGRWSRLGARHAQGAAAAGAGVAARHHALAQQASGPARVIHEATALAGAIQRDVNERAAGLGGDSHERVTRGLAQLQRAAQHLSELPTREHDAAITHFQELHDALRAAHRGRYALHVAHAPGEALGAQVPRPTVPRALTPAQATRYAQLYPARRARYEFSDVAQHLMGVRESGSGRPRLRGDLVGHAHLSDLLTRERMPPQVQLHREALGSVATSGMRDARWSGEGAIEAHHVKHYSGAEGGQEERDALDALAGALRSYAAAHLGHDLNLAGHAHTPEAYGRLPAASLALGTYMHHQGHPAPEHYLIRDKAGYSLGTYWSPDLIAHLGGARPKRGAVTLTRVAQNVAGLGLDEDSWRRLPPGERYEPKLVREPRHVSAFSVVDNYFDRPTKRAHTSRVNWE